ncbi:hypothetical protein [Winogradskyella sp. A3E31]|uniref:hypothetical protein n=1 Tax=Winogradskyella sp. A3E31 TaxID=3349637 RepID=UPI00398A698B
MTKGQKDNLFLLVKSLTKSEKRQFKLYVGRLDVNSDSKFLNLFNILDKASRYNEAEILKSGIVKKSQLANVKAHLYKQILISLKLNPSHQNIRSQIREQLDFASILYHKGLYNQSLKILDKSKELALQNEEKNIAYEIVELEKIIETQYITRSINNRAEELISEAENLNKLNVIASKLSNLSLQLYSIILKSGYVKSDAESKEISTYFKEQLPEFKISELGFREKLLLYNAYLWHSFLIQDFSRCFRYAKKWVNLYESNPEMIQLNPVSYLKGNQYLLEALYFIRDHSRFEKAFLDFENRISQKDFPKDDNIEGLCFLYLNNNRFNLFFMQGRFNDGLDHLDDLVKDIRHYQDRIDEHHIMVFYYKIASLYFGVGDYKNCIRYLDKIISNKSLKMREDLLCFSRVLNVVAHYEAGLDYHLESLLRSTYKFLLKMNDLHKVQKEMISFIRGLPDIYPHDIKDAFRGLHQRLKVYEDHPYERRAFLYLDILSWLESRIENIPVNEVIRNKYLAESKS